MCDMTHSYVWYDSFICVIWLIHMCDMTSNEPVTTRQKLIYTGTWLMSHVIHIQCKNVFNIDVYIYVYIKNNISSNRLVPVMTHSYTGTWPMSHVIHMKCKYLCQIDVYIYVYIKNNISWNRLVPVMTHLYRDMTHVSLHTGTRLTCMCDIHILYIDVEYRYGVAMVSRID